MPNSYIAASASIVISVLHFSHAAMADGGRLLTPSSEVILTARGKIEHTNTDDSAQFDLEMLKAMPAMEFTTETIWTRGKQTFRGVPFSEFLKGVGSTGTIVKIHAINDYVVALPIKDAVADGPIIAYMLNGKPMSRRGRGPLWVVYPYDRSNDFQTEVTYSRSVQQMDRIVIE